MSSVLCFSGGFPEREPEGGIERVEIKNVKEKTEKRSKEIGCILVEVTAMLLRKREEGDETAGSSQE